MGEYKESPKVDNGTKNVRYKNNKRSVRMQKIMRDSSVDFMAFYYEIEDGTVVQVSSCHEAMGLNYDVADDCFDSGFQLNIEPKDGVRHFKSNQGALNFLHLCEKRAYFTASFFWKKDDDGKWIAVPLLDDDAYLLKKNVANAFEKWAELANFEIEGKLSIKQVSIKVDEKPPFTTLAWVQKSSAGILTCLLDNGKMLCLSPENIGCEDVEVRPMGYYRTKFNLLQKLSEDVLQRVK